uniref:Retrovirus-related Pol polyprotein from transposon TNT 1-94 n=1 Tax=Cajanus cajan TaxID=3821 RepID=A0A151RVM0_CAJCA|nr:Retrovirus-related Pol polyprotein from transposon TNT 1-94 [Cajanus cajan]
MEDDPKTVRVVMTSKESKKWLNAMREEMKSLHENQTRKLVKKPPRARVVSCKWLFKKKERIPRIEPERFKARLVARGFTQKKGIDFNEVLFPVVKHRSIILILSMVAQLDLELEQMDVKTAFLYGYLDEEILMSQPEGFEVKGKVDYVCKLTKSLYGLKQSPKQWNRRFDEFMEHVKFIESHYDNCVYFKFLKQGLFVVLFFYVYDILLVSNNKVEIAKVKSKLSKEFEMKNLRLGKKILRVEISRNR